MKKKKKAETREEIIQAGIDAMTHSIMSLVEVCVRQRCEQFVRIMDESLGGKIK